MSARMSTRTCLRAHVCTHVHAHAQIGVAAEMKFVGKRSTHSIAWTISGGFVVITIPVSVYRDMCVDICVRASMGVCIERH